MLKLSSMGCCRLSSHSGICGFCVKAFKWLPVLVISAILVWSYYAYVVHLCILTIESEPVRYTLIVIFHLLFCLFLWSYWRTIWSHPGKVPHRFRLTAEELDRLEGAESDLEQRRLLDQVVVTRDLPVTMRTIQGCVRYCDRCTHIKPDRAHHCSVCGDCVLKMDHHCPWVNNCVAFNNYKFFVLFLLYGFTYCIFIAFSVLKYFLQFWARSLDSPGQSKFHILFLFFVSAMFSISLCSLLCYHIHLVLNNRTTLEAFRAPVFSRGPDKEGFSLGRLANLQEVFGDDWKAFLLPVFSSFGDGLTFPQRFVDEERGGGGGGVGRSQDRQVSRWEVEEERVPMLSREEGRGGAGDEEMEGGNLFLSASDSEEEGLVHVRGEVTPPSLRVSVQS